MSNSSTACQLRWGQIEWHYNSQPLYDLSPKTLMQQTSIITAAILLFFIMDPLGNTPVMGSMLKDLPLRRAQKIIVREYLFALSVLVVFLFTGSTIMKYLDISAASLGISGGVVLFLIAVKMVFGDPHDFMGIKDQLSEEPFFVPIAVPLIAGPSAMATLLLFVSREPSRWLTWLGALLIAWIGSLIITLNSTYVLRLLGKRGVIAMQRLMGMLLVAISIELIVKGIRQAFGL